MRSETIKYILHRCLGILDYVLLGEWLSAVWVGARVLKSEVLGTEIPPQYDITVGCNPA